MTRTGSDGLRVAIDLRVAQQALRDSENGGLGGRARLALELGRSLLRRPDSTTYLLLADRGPVDERLLELARSSPRARLVQIGFPAALAAMAHGRGAALARALEARLLERELRALSVDVVHFPDQPAPRLRSLPAILTLHDLWTLHPETRDEPGMLASFSRRQLRAYARGDETIVCVSASTAEEAERLLGVGRERLQVCHSGVDTSIFHPEDERPALPPYLLHVGVLSERKNRDGLLAAFAHVAATLPDLQLVCAGPYQVAPLEREHIEARARELGVEERVRLEVNPIDAELATLYRGAAGLAFPSLHEGFGFPLLEALACGIPCLASDTSAFPEVAGDLALLVDPSNGAAIADGMHRLVCDSALRARVRHEGPRWAARFSWDATAAAVAELHVRAARLDSRLAGVA